MADVDTTAAPAMKPALLILSDGKPGHLNQSVAFARLLGCPYEVRRVRFVNRLCKAASYLFDRLGWGAPWLFRVDGELPAFKAVVSAGSETYYANRLLARRGGVRSVATMLPRGYRYDFDLIVAQQHDQPPQQENILVVPVNLSCPEPSGLVHAAPGKRCIAMIIGGPSRHCDMDARRVAEQMQQVFALFPGADFLATTSRRTPPEVEALVEQGPFRYKVIASREQVNPIADFLAISDYVFVTEDSTSMISEAVSFGNANVEILPLSSDPATGKIRRMIDSLQTEGLVHLFDGRTGRCNRKIDLGALLRRTWQ